MASQRFRVSSQFCALDAEETCFDLRIYLSTDALQGTPAQPLRPALTPKMWDGRTGRQDPVGPRCDLPGCHGVRTASGHGWACGSAGSRDPVPRGRGSGSRCAIGFRNFISQQNQHCRLRNTPPKVREVKTGKVGCTQLKVSLPESGKDSCVIGFRNVLPWFSSVHAERWAPHLPTSSARDPRAEDWRGARQARRPPSSTSEVRTYNSRHTHSV